MIERSGYQRARTSPMLWIAALAVGMTMLLPVAYLVGRTLTTEEVLSDQLFRSRTGAILVRSLVLAAVVTTLATAVGVPLAWLTARTDLPLRRLFTVVSVLPLVIPSYLAGFLYAVALGPKGLVQGWLAPSRSRPVVRCLWSDRRCLHAGVPQLPIRPLAGAGCPAGHGPCVRGGRPQPWPEGSSGLRPGDRSDDSACRDGRRIAHGPVYPQ